MYEFEWDASIRALEVYKYGDNGDAVPFTQGVFKRGKSWSCKPMYKIWLPKELLEALDLSRGMVKK